eukprot:SAG31_NODE_536_length_14340_cov_9.449196_8_plen_95_part_00
MIFHEQWAPVDGGSQTFTAVADSSPWNNASAAAASVSASGGGELATMTTTPPAAPNVFTAFLMGDAKYKYTLLPQVDAPVSPMSERFQRKRTRF